MPFTISTKVRLKLAEKHGVSEEEINECFLNREGPYFSDNREDNRTDPPTYWFVASTDKGRILKVVFVRHPDRFAIKTAFEPTDGSDRLYLDLIQTCKS